MQKQHSESRFRDLLTTDEAARFLADHGLPTTAGALSMRRSHGLPPRFIELGGRAVRYRRADLEAWRRSRIAERAKAAKQKRAGLD